MTTRAWGTRPGPGLREKRTVGSVRAGGSRPTPGAQAAGRVAAEPREKSGAGVCG